MILGIIPARAGSTGVPDKNLVSGPLFQGRPLVTWAVHEALMSKHLDAIVVSTNDPATATELGKIPRVQIHRRQDSLSGPDSPTEETIAAVLQNYEPDIIVLLQLTSPTRMAEDIDQAITDFKAEGYDSMVSVVADHGFTWYDADGQAVPNYKPSDRPMRQKQQMWKENGSIYIFTHELWKREHCRLGGWIGLFKTQRHHAIEIDEPMDIVLAETMLAYGRREMYGVRG
jgi:CMP-N,N'-diacetyllegionaminic acid synthase